MPYTYSILGITSVSSAEYYVSVTSSEGGAALRLQPRCVHGLGASVGLPRLSATQLTSVSFDVPRPHLVCRPTFADTTTPQDRKAHQTTRPAYTTTGWFIIVAKHTSSRVLIS
jgi:hypothetical protein